jgi:DNA-binding SARP family transcriptional activator
MGAGFWRISAGIRRKILGRNMLRINALGCLTVFGDAGPVSGAAAQPRRLAILALLARAGERGITRDKIVTFLWPDTDDERARSTLSKTLYTVRRDLGAEDVIVGTRDLRLNPDVITSDVAEFTRAMAEGEHERAASIYRGPFLDGFRLPGAADFDRWIDTEREILRHDYEVVLETLAKRSAELGDQLGAVRWWRTLAALDPLNGRHALGLMRAMDAAGDRAGAIQHARIYDTLVQEELDLPPDREVVAFARQLRETSANSERAKQAPAPLPAPAPAYVPLPEPPSVATVVFDPPAEPIPNAPAPPVPARSRRPSVWVIAGLAAVAIVGAIISLARSSDRTAAGDLPLIALGRIADYRPNAESELARPLTDMLATSVGRIAGARVVSTARMYELLSQAGDGDTSPAALVAAARRAGATELIDGALYAADSGRLRLDLRRIDLASGAMRATHSVIGSSLIELADSGTARLAAAWGADRPLGSIADVTTHSISAYRLYEQGLRAYYQRDLRGAIGFFDAALVEDSTFAMAAYYRALADRGDRQRTFALLDRAARLARHATDRERLTIMATLAAQRDERSLRVIAETLVVRYPAEVDGYLFSGIALVNGADFSGALPYLERAVAMDSLAFTGERARCAACEAMHAIVSAYQHMDSLASAEREVRRWIRLQPRSAEAWRTLGEVLEQRGRFDDAIVALRKEGEIDPSNLAIEPTDVASYRIYAGDYEQAERLLSGQLEGVVPSQEREAHWFLALSYRQQARFAEALAHARRFRTLGGAETPDAVPPTTAVLEAQVLLEMGRFREAAALFDSIPRAYRRDEAPAHLARYTAWNMTHAANALAAAGDTGGLAARADSVRVLGADILSERDRRLHHHIRGLLLAARGRDDEAEAELRQAIFSVNMGYTRTNFELGRLYLRQRRPRDAIAIVQPALQGSLEAANLYVTRTELHELLAQAWEALGGAAARDSAAAHWAEVTRAWQRADPLFVPRFERARTRLTALTTSRPGTSSPAPR